MKPAQSVFIQTVQLYKSPLRYQEKALRPNPKHPKYATKLGGTICNLSNLVRDGGRRDDALTWYARAIATLSSVVQKEQEGPTLATARRFLLTSHGNRAETFDQLQRHDE